MRLIRYRSPIDGIPRMGLVEDAIVHELENPDFLDILDPSTDEPINITRTKRRHRLGVIEPLLLRPIRPSKLVGFGVTFEKGKERGGEEGNLNNDPYQRVYEAERPEIFKKGDAKDCAGPGEPLYLREDVIYPTPEAELVFVVGYGREPVAYTLGNDFTDRGIELMNPLYLPQAKTSVKCASIGPSLVIPDKIDQFDPFNLEMKLQVIRGKEVVYEGRQNTSQMRRRMEIMEYLFRGSTIPEGTVVFTGTGIPPMPEPGLQHGDVVEIYAGPIGLLRNPVLEYKHPILTSRP